MHEGYITCKEPWMASEFLKQLGSWWGYLLRRGQQEEGELTVLEVLNLRCPFKIYIDFSRSLQATQWTGQDGISKWKESLALIGI